MTSERLVAGRDLVDLADFGLFDAEIQQQPHAYYAAMRSGAPVYATDALGMPVWLVTTHDLVLEVLRDPSTYSSKFGSAGMPADPELAARLRQLREDHGGWPAVPTMLSADPPEQTRYRKLVSKAFTPRSITDLEPAIRAITRRLIDSWIGNGGIEFVAEFAVPLPVETIAKALAVPDDRLADFKRWSDDNVAPIGASLTPDQRMAAEMGQIEMQHFFAEQLERRRAEPGDDILSRLVTARIDTAGIDTANADPAEDPDLPDEPLTMSEMQSILSQLLVAGNETTTKLLTEMMLLLGRHPERWHQVRHDPSFAKPIIEEVLRLSTPTQGMWRITTRDVELGGVAIPAGRRIVLMYTSANRDERHFVDPDTFDPDRSNLVNHLAFGKGIHYCVGANLSRLEARVALEELSARVASFRLAESNSYEYHPSFMLRGLKRLDLELTPAR